MWCLIKIKSKCKCGETGDSESMFVFSGVVFHQCVFLSGEIIKPHKLRQNTLVKKQTPLMTGWWFGTVGLFFHSVGNVMIRIDELIFFRRGRYTTNQIMFHYRLPCLFFLLDTIFFCCVMDVMEMRSGGRSATDQQLVAGLGAAASKRSMTW